MQELLQKKCVPCEGIGKAFTEKEAQEYLKKVDNWEIKENKRIEKTFKFKNFVQAIEFANKITEIAEQEQHHPDLYIGWGKVRVELWTHALNGLTENDFILAAKIDAIKK